MRRYRREKAERAAVCPAAGEEYPALVHYSVIPFQSGLYTQTLVSKQSSTLEHQVPNAWCRSLTSGKIKCKLCDMAAALGLWCLPVLAKYEICSKGGLYCLVALRLQRQTC